ncbi:uncharacterized protein LOC116346473 [Contarinia nasturtii]|uniref:uncharacterized protein LOC116346473 n=1 Tax=Contarinia nasturtii TaxID=265458 RepID=UPI0012D47E90|nr:uncharacterized protein LOC116346473 [Contarinia nasturtii]
MKILLLIVVFVAVVAALPYPWLSDFPSESIDTMMGNFERLANDNRRTGYFNSDDYPANSPFKKIIYRQIPQPFKKEIRLPVYLHAKIKRSHLQDLPSRSGIPSDIYNLLEAKDFRLHDEVGHLLAYSLGGGMENTLNYVPMAICLNRGPYLKTEQEIGAFLKKEQNGEVDWHLVVIYDKFLRNKQGAFDDSVNLDSYNLRPIGFCLKYSTKTRADARPVNGARKCFFNVLHDSLDAPKN